MNISKFLKYIRNNQISAVNTLKNNNENYYLSFSEYFSIFPQRLDLVYSLPIDNKVSDIVIGIKSQLSNYLEQEALKVFENRQYTSYYNPNIAVEYQDGDVIIGKYARLHLSSNVNLSSNDYRAILELDNFNGKALLQGYDFEISSMLSDVKIYTYPSQEIGFGDNLLVEINQNENNVQKIHINKDILSLKLFNQSDKYLYDIQFLPDNFSLFFKEKLNLKVSDTQLDLSYPNISIRLSDNNKEIFIKTDRVMQQTKEYIINSQTFQFQAGSFILDNGTNLNLKQTNIEVNMGGSVSIKGIDSRGDIVNIIFPKTIVLKINNSSYKIPIL